MYIVDMYRGIIQHKTYLTPYLKNEIKARSLTKPLTCGRIYKVFPSGKKPPVVTIPQEASQLVALLGSPNGWMRNEVQQLLIDRQHKEVAPALRTNLTSPGNTLQLIHSLWTLEGLGVLQPADVLPLLQQSDWKVQMQGLSVLPSILDKKNYKQFLPVLQKMIDQNDTLAAPYIGFLIHTIQPIDAAAASRLSETLTRKYASNVFVADAIISNLKNKEADYYKKALTYNSDTALAINKRLRKVIEDISKAKNNSNAENIAKLYPKGVALFGSVCQTCHGKDGNGVPSLAPPLNGSEWVVGNKDKLIAIVMYGLTGPVKIAGKVYKAPEINGDMPGIGQNSEYTDDDIAQVLSFIRSSWGNKAEKITATDITNLRSKFKDRQKNFTVDELNKLK
jgi:mono/diheme cytochrome c family protein